MEQLTSGHEEYLRQAPFELSINKLLDVIDIKIATRQPIYSVVDSLYNKVSGILDSEEIDKMYNNITKNKPNVYNACYKEYYTKHSKKINESDRSPDWTYWSNSHIDRQVNFMANSAITFECKKLVRLIIKELKDKRLILITKNELESSHE